MSRSARRDELLDAAMAHLADRGIDNVTFRAMAAELGISTYPLVYHFGSKAELLTTVVAEIERRERAVAEPVIGDVSRWHEYWGWCVEHRAMLRLSFDIALVSARDPGRFGGNVIRHALDGWLGLWTDRLTASGTAPDDAGAVATMMMGAVVGLRWDLAVTGDVDRTTAAFTRLQRALSADPALTGG